MDIKRYARQREQLNFERTAFHKTIKGKVYTYTPYGEHLFKKTDPKGQSIFVKHLPDDLD